MYQALYRKYRPITFGDVCGQQHITKTLLNSLSSGKVSHAYLFTGTRGTGKTSCAKILAKAVCCLEPVNGEPCGKCSACRAIADNATTDIIEIDAASNNGVNDIRDLREQVNYLPTVLKYKVYIIDEVHMLSGPAFNALLKTLEEPPKHIIFILATTEVHKLPATILSRCQRFDFKRLDTDVLSDRMKHIAEKEGFALDNSAALLIAGLADGGMRDALSILDQCSSCGDTVTDELVFSVCGIAGNETTNKLATFITENDAAGAINLIDELYKNSVDMKKLLYELSGYYRNLMIIKTVKESRPLIVCSDIEYADMCSLAERLTLTDIIKKLSLLQKNADDLHFTGSKSEVELIAVRLCTPELFGSDSLEKRVEKLEKVFQNGAFTDAKNATGSAPDISARPDYFKDSGTTNVKTKEKSSDKPTIKTDIISNNARKMSSDDGGEFVPPPEDNDIPSPSTAIYEDDTRATAPDNTENGKPHKVIKWPEILQILRITCPLLAGVLNDSSAYTMGTRLLVDCKLSQFRDLINSDSKYRDYLKKAAYQVLGESYRLGPYDPKKYVTVPKADPLEVFAKSIEDKNV